jgi:hypothetical protein
LETLSLMKREMRREIKTKGYRRVLGCWDLD